MAHAIAKVSRKGSKQGVPSNHFFASQWNKSTLQKGVHCVKWHTQSPRFPAKAANRASQAITFLLASGTKAHSKKVYIVLNGTRNRQGFPQRQQTGRPKQSLFC